MKRNGLRWSWGLLVLMLLTVIGLGGYLFNEKKNLDKVSVVSEIEGLEVELVNQELFLDIYEVMRIWEAGMRPRWDQPFLIYPESFRFIVTDKEQNKLLIGEKDKPIATSLGYEYDGDKKIMTIYMHYADYFREDLGQENLEKRISRDLIYYPFILGKDRMESGWDNYKRYAKSGKRRTEQYLGGNKLVVIGEGE